MSKQAEAAAAVIFDFVYPGRYDETGNVTGRYAGIISAAYAEREKAVAELVAACLPFTNMGNYHSERLAKAIEAVEGGE